MFQILVIICEENTMNISKMFMGLTGVVVAAAVLGVADCAKAADGAANAKKSDVAVEDAEVKENAILFKIHDIVPVKNSDDEVIGCDYNTTIYNRSNMTLQGATIDLTWQDDAITEVIDQEKKEDAKQNKRSMGRARSTTERNTDKTISGLVEVPLIKPLKQVMVQSRINTDRCFLLIENPKVDIRNCSAETAQGRATSAGSRRGGGSCTELFQYVSPEDAQYYLEFKAVTVDQEAEEREAKKAKEKSEIDGLYQKGVATIDATGTIVSSIK